MNVYQKPLVSHLSSFWPTLYSSGILATSLEWTPALGCSPALLPSAQGFCLSSGTRACKSEEVRGSSNPWPAGLEVAEPGSLLWHSVEALRCPQPVPARGALAAHSSDQPHGAHVLAFFLSHPLSHSTAPAPENQIWKWLASKPFSAFSTCKEVAEMEKSLNSMKTNIWSL